MAQGMSKALSLTEISAIVEEERRNARGAASAHVQWPTFEDHPALISAVESDNSTVTLTMFGTNKKRMEFGIHRYKDLPETDDRFFIMPTTPGVHTPCGCMSLARLKENYAAYKAALVILEEDAVTKAAQGK